MEIIVKHALGVDEALLRVKNLLKDLQEQYKNEIKDLKEEWKDNVGIYSLRAYGFNLSGKIRVEPDKVVMTGKVPLVARPFSAQIENTIRKEAEKLLH